MRRKIKVRNKVKPDYKYGSFELEKFVNYIMEEGKKTTARRIVYSALDIEELKRLMPIQNNGTSAENIARIGKHFLEYPDISLNEIRKQFEYNYNII